MNSLLEWIIQHALWLSMGSVLTIIGIIFYIKNQQRKTQYFQTLFTQVHELKQDIQTHRNHLDQQHLQSFGLIQNSLQHSNEVLSQRLDYMTDNLHSRLHTLGGYLEERVSTGLVKTTETFGQIMERLSLIDAAQQQMQTLSGQVLNLQQILTDKRARGAFGEMQLNDLIKNMLPPNCFKLQHTFNNKKRADCVLFLPPPTGTIAIDAKFPLENFRKAVDHTLPDVVQRAAQAQFRQDIRNHIQAVASKYIIPDETSDSVILFIPAETIFAEIHTHYNMLVEEAQHARVWLTSPSTLMAVLTTVRAVLKDAQTREQAHLIQKHLGRLKIDFVRFQQRMNKLAQHVQQANEDIQDAQISAKKITQNFEYVEKVELDSLQKVLIEQDEESTAI